jgi:opacity protein-like surface antigen
MIIRLNVCAVSVIALGAACNPAFAADWNNGAGSLKDPGGRAAVAVPAPMPIPESHGTGWYLRGDIGIGRGGSRDISEGGQSYGVTGADFLMTAPTAPFGSSPSWFNNDGKTLLNYGVGLGYHWSPNFRTDVTLDRRNPDKYTGRGTYTYDYQTVSLASDTRVVGMVSDDTTVKSGTMLLNGYYDLGSRYGVTPYIGAGIGLALLTVNRDAGVVEASCDLTAVPDCHPASADYLAKTGGSASTNAFTFAAMATAGVSYSLTRNTAIDVNYRYLHINGTDISTTVNGQNSKVTIGNIGDHQLRAGLRWDIN